MILYFADRQLNILGQASTKLPQGLTIKNDKMIADVETGVSSFECEVPYDRKTRELVESCTEVGNYLLCGANSEKECEFYTIIDGELDTYKRTGYIYAEDAGMDLLNDVYGEYEADKAYPITHYINKFAAGSGFVIGVNEAKNLTRKLSWDGESTAAERIASVATQFDGCEISYTFEVKNLTVTKKFINIYKQRGKDIGVQLRLNRDIDSIITTKSIANLATALQCTGGTPEDAEDPITLKGYKYDDGDFYVDSSGVLKSRTALKRWARYLWKDDDATESGGHITKQYSYDTTSQKTLCSRAITELKKICEMEINYEIDIKRLPDNVKVGDRVNIIDDEGGLYLSARMLQIERSECDESHSAILGEYLIKNDGISQKVADLAAQFAKQSQSAARALAMAQTAKTAATDAKERVDAAIESVEEAQKAVEDVADVVETARQSAAAAQEAANNAQSVVDGVENRIESLEGSLSNAEEAARQAQQAAQTAETKATEAQQAAVNAEAEAAEAKDAAEQAQNKANQAEVTASSAKGIAEQAIDDAETASATAAAANLDAEAAKADIDSLGERLTTVSNTMEADYARKTELTETEASLQSQISRNAALLQSTITLNTVIDETANDADSYAEQAQAKAQEAQAQATQAAADAAAAQVAADQATQAAADAQAEADTARAAAATAQNVADQAAATLTAAKEDLATIESRVDATEAEIEAARQAVANAQAAADTAQANAERAVNEAAAAQKTANDAVAAANNARAEADNAARYARYAQAVANEAKAAQEAQETADDAAAIASEAQRTAAQAVTDAETAQAAADTAAAAAATAQQAANNADAKAVQAASELETAKQNLENVTSRVDATKEEVEAAQQAVNTAQAAADKAKQDAAAAQSTADKAKADAATAQTAASNAKAAADQAQADANTAKQAADKAQSDVNKLTVTVTEQGTAISQKADRIELNAYKTEVSQTLGGYYTKTETDAKIQVESNSIKQTVSAEITEKVNAVEIGGRNLYTGTADFSGDKWANIAEYTADGTDGFGNVVLTKTNAWLGLFQERQAKAGEVYTLSVNARGDGVAKLWFYASEVLADGTENTHGVKDFGVCPTTETRFSESWKVRNDCTLRFRVENSIAGQRLWVSSLKLEKGNKATDWTPAPEDMASADLVETTRSDLSASLSDVAAGIESVAGEVGANKDALNEALLIVEENSEQITSLIQEASGITMEFTTINETVTQLNDKLEKEVDERYSYIRFIDGEIWLGKEAEPGEDDFKVSISNERMSFWEDGVEIAYMSNNKLYISDAHVTGSLNIGPEIKHFRWETRNGGRNLGIRPI
jgi:phage minor structural protein